MTYKETIEFLFATLPMYQRIGDAAIKKDLTNIKKLCAILHDPHLAFKTIHIAGTNGKGSTSHMLSSIFQASGKKTGLYTSPHYIDFRERIKVDGVMISEKQVMRFVKRYHKDWAEIKPSFFEISVAMAFDHFRNEKIDIAIIETGLGGRLDSTNIITPELSVITNIGFDHMQILGNTLPEIASEKAGIIKQNIPVVVGEWSKQTSSVFKAHASNKTAPLFYASKRIKVERIKNTFDKMILHVQSASTVLFERLQTDLVGPYQIKNITTVISACMTWNIFYPLEALTKKAIRAGIKNVKSSTNMIGRWMIIHKHPLVITDAAHNLDGIKNILPDLINLPSKHRHFVLGFVGDKDVAKVLSLFPKDAFYYWCSPDIPRGKSPSETQLIGLLHSLNGSTYSSVDNAYQAALALAHKSDLIFVGGSSYVVGDFLEYLKKNK